MFSAALYAHARTTSTIAHETSGAARIRHSLRPLFGEGEEFQHNSDAWRRENAKLYPPSLRGALATKQSTLTLPHDGLLRFARNDGERAAPGPGDMVTCNDGCRPT